MFCYATNVPTDNHANLANHWTNDLKRNKVRVNFSKKKYIDSNTKLVLYFFAKINHVSSDSLQNIQILGGWGFVINFSKKKSRGETSKQMILFRDDAKLYDFIKKHCSENNYYI